MQELAPQSDDGDYVRPTYTFNGRIGDADFPVGAETIGVEWQRSGAFPCPLKAVA
jgi:hypothetical protein